MRIFFRKVEIHNFMSFADEVFDFSAHHGMNLVTGKNFDIPNSKNGSGKSSLFLSLLYGLYGQFPNKIKSEHINNRNVEDKEVRVVVYLNVDDVEYKAISGLNKRAAGYFNLYRLDGDNEIDITKSSIAETRDFFENEVLHCDISLFLRTILLTSEQNYNFFCLKKQDKKEFIEKLFDIGIFGEMYSKIHKDTLSSDKQILVHQNQVVVLNQNEEDYSNRLKTFNDNQLEQKEQIQKQLIEVQEKLEQHKAKVIEKNTELIKQYEDAKIKLDEASQKVSQKMQDKKVSLAKMSSEIQYLKNDMSSKKNALDKHSELIGKLCNDCKQVFLSYHNLASCQSDINNAIEKINIKTTESDTQKKDYSELKIKLDQIQDKIKKVSQKISELNLEYDKAIQSQVNTEKSLDLLKFNLKKIEEQTNPYIELLRKVQDQIKSEKEQLNKLEEDNKYLKKAEEIVSQDSLKKFIIKDLISIINNKIKMYLTRMGSKYTCTFDDNLDYEFITESGPCELYNFSCGEKKRIEIATCLSFRDFIAQRSNISSNVLILDEYIDSGIDTLAVESILGILKEFTISQDQNIYIISHRSEVSTDLFDSIIELQKKDGISKIEYLDE